MSRNSSLKHFLTKKWVLAILLPAWILVAFFLAQIITGIFIGILSLIGFPVTTVNEAVFNTVVGAVVYILALILTIGLPWLILKRPLKKSDVYLETLPRWQHFLVTPLAFFVYFIISGGLLAIFQWLVPGIDYSQAQELGFEGVTERFEYILAFIMLVILAPVAEEILFRGYLFSGLRKRLPLWGAILITSVVFGLIHGQWNVAIDTFALSLVLCLLVVWTKSLWPAIMLHMLKNFIAFYFLFINPSLLSTLGG